MKTDTSKKLFQQACQFLVGGVNSPVRAFKGVGGDPLFIKRAKGARIWDVDGNEYIDYVGSWGPMILGHAHNKVLVALKEVMESGTSFGAPTELEIKLARLVIDAVPSIEKVRFVNSGTEATMSALRLARGYTKRDKIIKFSGCYHGHADFLLVKAGSGAQTLGLPDSPGVPADFAMLMLIARYNDLDSVQALFEKNKGQIAAVIVEPVVGNFGVLVPEKGFLSGLREITTQNGALLIFDEVMTGFRVAYGGAQAYYRVVPDLTCLGKIIGGGLPVGAYGGKKEIMDMVAPQGPVYQAGTLSGNPLAIQAGIVTLELLKELGVYDRLEAMGAMLEEGLSEAAASNDIPCVVNRVGSMFSVFFTSGRVINDEDARRSDKELFKKFFHGMLEQGIYLAPSAFEAGFISTAHTVDDIRRTIAAAHQALGS